MVGMYAAEPISAPLQPSQESGEKVRFAGKYSRHELSQDWGQYDKCNEIGQDLQNVACGHPSPLLELLRVEHGIREICQKHYCEYASHAKCHILSFRSVASLLYRGLETAVAQHVSHEAHCKETSANIEV
jgi:hypothetical protein